MRRLLAGWITGLLLVALAAAPAGAQSDEPGVYITSPSKGELQGSVAIEAYAVPDSGLILGVGRERIDSITVTITAKTNGASPSPITKPGERFSASWNTRSLTPHNGVYDLTARVNSNRDDPASATVTGLKVNNPPAAPTDVSASLQGETPVVTWKANSEPDLTGYRVLRAVASGSFEQVGSVKTNKFTDSEAPAGLALRYQVVAVRNSPVSDSGITAKSSSSKPVTIPAPAAAEGQGEGEGAPVPEDVFVPETTTAEPAPEPEPAPPPAQNSGPLAPIIRDEPLAQTNVDFAEQLPFDADLPERFNSSGSPSINAAQSAATDDGGATVVSPMRFIAAGLFLLVFSIILARTSRRLFKGKPDADGPKAPRVSYPAFRISRS